VAGVRNSDGDQADIRGSAWPLPQDSEPSLSCPRTRDVGRDHIAGGRGFVRELCQPRPQRPPPPDLRLGRGGRYHLDRLTNRHADSHGQLGTHDCGECLLHPRCQVTVAVVNDRTFLITSTSTPGARACAPDRPQSNRAEKPCCAKAPTETHRRGKVQPPFSQIAIRLARVHEQLITATERLTEEQITWRPNLDTPPIQFHLWHKARSRCSWSTLDPLEERVAVVQRRRLRRTPDRAGPVGDRRTVDHSHVSGTRRDCLRASRFLEHRAGLLANSLAVAVTAVVVEDVDNLLPLSSVCIGKYLWSSVLADDERAPHASRFVARL
jgi:hypothetical protein